MAAQEPEDGGAGRPGKHVGGHPALVVQAEVGAHRRAQVPVLDVLLCHRERRAPSVVEVHHHAHIVAPRRFHDAAHVNRRGGQRLFDEHVDAALGAFHGYIGVGEVGRYDRHRVGLHHVEHGAIVGIDFLHPEFFGERLGFSQVQIADGHELGLWVFLVQISVRTPPGSGPDDGDAYLCRHIRPPADAIVFLLFHCPEGHAPDELFLYQESEDQDRKNGDHPYRRHFAPEHPGDGEKLGHDGGHRLCPEARQEKGEGELVPGLNDAENSRGDQPRRNEGNNDAEEAAHAGAAVQPGRFLEFLGDVLDVAPHHPDGEGNVEAHVDDAQIQLFVQHPQHAAEDEEGNHHRHRREHAQRQYPEREAFLLLELEAREAIGGHRPESRTEAATVVDTTITLLSRFSGRFLFVKTSM